MRPERRWLIVGVILLACLGIMVGVGVGLVLAAKNMMYSRDMPQTKMAFSVDGTKVGWARSLTWHLYRIEAPPSKVEVRFHWRNVNNGRQREVQAYYAEGSDSFLAVDFAFSPDSRYAAVSSPLQLSFIDLESGKVVGHSPLGSRVEGFAWLNAQEVRYVCDGYAWQQNVEAGPGQERKLCAVTNEGPVYWAPGARHAALIGVGESDRWLLNVLDVSTGEPIATVTLPVSGGHSSRQSLETLKLSATWNPDGTEVFCDLRAYRIKPLMYLVKVPSGQVLDASVALGGKVGQTVPNRFRWASDGAYILADGSFWQDAERMDAYLIQPQTWSVTNVSSSLPPNVWTYPRRFPQLVPLSVSGWVGVQVMAADGSRELVYAVDYGFKKTILLDRSSNAAVSPDGTCLAVLDHQNDRIELRDTSIEPIPVN